MSLDGELFHLPKCFNIVGSIGTSSEIGEVELNLIPALVETHGHRTYEWLYTGR